MTKKKIAGPKKTITVEVTRPGGVGVSMRLAPERPNEPDPDTARLAPRIAEIRDACDDAERTAQSLIPHNPLRAVHRRRVEAMHAALVKAQIDEPAGESGLGIGFD